MGLMSEKKELNISIKNNCVDTETYNLFVNQDQAPTVEGNNTKVNLTNLPVIQGIQYPPFDWFYNPIKNAINGFCNSGIGNDFIEWNVETGVIVSGTGQNFGPPTLLGEFGFLFNPRYYEFNGQKLLLNVNTSVDRNGVTQNKLSICSFDDDYTFGTNNSIVSALNPLYYGSPASAQNTAYMFGIEGQNLIFNLRVISGTNCELVRVNSDLSETIIVPSLFGVTNIGSFSQDPSIQRIVNYVYSPSYKKLLLYCYDGTNAFLHFINIETGDIESIDYSSLMVGPSLFYDSIRERFYVLASNDTRAYNVFNNSVFASGVNTQNVTPYSTSYNQNYSQSGVLSNDFLYYGDEAGVKSIELDSFTKIEDQVASGSSFFQYIPNAELFVVRTESQNFSIYNSDWELVKELDWNVGQLTPAVLKVINNKFIAFYTATDYTDPIGEYYLYNLETSDCLTINVNGGVTSIDELNAFMNSQGICVDEFKFDTTTKSSFNYPLTYTDSRSAGSIASSKKNLFEFFNAYADQFVVDVPFKKVTGKCLLGFGAYLTKTIPGGAIENITIKYREYAPNYLVNGGPTILEPLRKEKKKRTYYRKIWGLL
jgi:hypothetical protein